MVKTTSLAVTGVPSCQTAFWRKGEGSGGVRNLPRLGEIADESLKIGGDGHQPSIDHAVDLELAATIDDVAVFDRGRIRPATATLGCARIEAERHRVLRAHRAGIRERHAERQAQSQRHRSLENVATGQLARLRAGDQCVDTESSFRSFVLPLNI